MARPTRRTFTKLLGAVSASSLVATETACSVPAPAPAPAADAHLTALLAAHGAADVFTNPDRLAELAAAVERSQARVATLRRFQIPADVTPIVTFRKD